MNIKNLWIKKMQEPGYADHKTAFSRREMIRLGLIAGGGALLPLGRLDRAFAQAVAQPMPFLVFDLAGGAAMPGNFLAGQKGGPEDLFADYSRHGWNPRDAGALNKNFGVPMSQQRSQMLAGMLQTLPASIGKDPGQRKFKMSSFAHFSLDDTNTNHSSAITMVSKAGLKGKYMRSGISMLSSGSGGNSDVFLRDSKFKPMAVTSLKDVLDLPLFDDRYAELAPQTRRAIFERLKAAAGSNGALREAYESIAELGVRQEAMDYRKETALAEIFNGASEVEASIIFNVLAGNTGPGVLTFAGCDYHNNTGTTGDAIDAGIGRAIGRAVAAAEAMNKPLMFQIITDGGVYAPQSANYERVWVGDANQHSLSILGYFHPTRPVEQIRLQVGHYTKGGQVEQGTLIGAGPEKMAAAVILNYLNSMGRIDQFEAVSGTRLQANEIDQLLVFA